MAGGREGTPRFTDRAICKRLSRAVAPRPIRRSETRRERNHDQTDLPAVPDRTGSDRPRGTVRRHGLGQRRGIEERPGGAHRSSREGGQVIRARKLEELAEKR